MLTPIAKHIAENTLVMPKHILVATDLTDMGYLLPYVVTQTKASNAQVTLLHAVVPSDSLPVETAMVSYIDREAIDRDVRATLLGMTRQIEARGIRCDISIIHGYAANVIREEIRRTGATRLILGAHGRGKIGQLALGSVAHELLTKVDVPIFAIGPHAHDAVTHVALRHILHPFSFRDDNQESFHLAFGIAQAYGAQLTLLHVSDQKFQDRINPLRTVDWAKNAMEALIPAVTDLASPVHMRVTSGDLAEEVLNEAIHTNADLIVLGTDGGFRPWSFRETAAYKVLAEANCPVLTVRHEPHQIVTRD